MNWSSRIEFFHPLSEEDLSLFAAPRDVWRAAASYNHALEAWLGGACGEAARALEQISRDYPMFVQSGHLYAVLLAVEGRYAEAHEQLSKVALLDLNEDEQQRVRVELQELEREVTKLRRHNVARQRREKLLMPVKSELVRHGILYKAPSHAERGPARMDSPEACRYEEENRREQVKTIRFLLVGLSLALAILLLFFFLIRPGILKRRAVYEEASRRLAWLEEELMQRAPRSPDTARLLVAYQEWLEGGGAQAGRATDATAQTTAETDTTDAKGEAAQTAEESGAAEQPTEMSESGSSGSGN